jgi:hypothetical protein
MKCTKENQRGVERVLFKANETVTRATHAVNTNLGHGIASRVPVAWEKIWNDLSPCAVGENILGSPTIPLQLVCILGFARNRGLVCKNR